MPGGAIIQTTGSYEMVENGPVPQLYVWQTIRELDGETMKPKGSLQTSTQIFHFKKGMFVLPKAP